MTARFAAIQLQLNFPEPSPGRLCDRALRRLDCETAGSPAATILEAPIAIGAKRYGVIQIRPTSHGFEQTDLEHLRLIGWCIARTVEAIRLQSVLGSHFTKLALAPANGRSARQVIAASAQHPDKTARLLARTFYRELARAGYTCNQIVSAASEIISQLTSNLREEKSTRFESAKPAVAMHPE